MSITSTSIGDNTVQISTSGTTFSAFLSAVTDAITGTTPTKTTGWSLYDQVTVGIITTQVFRSLNEDNSTYKYAILRWNVVTNELNTATGESWNNTTHVATNECWTFFDCAPIPFYTTGCDFLIFVHPRWLAFNAYIANEASVWAGVFEIEREDAQDTSSLNIPCWGWISSTLWMLGASVTNSTSATSETGSTLICLPRTKSGMTGINAAKTWSADYGVTTYPSFLGTNVTHFMYQLGNQVNKYISSAWDTTKRLALPIRPIHNYTSKLSEPHGKIHGLKVTAPAGTAMNKLQLSLDGNGNFSTSGTLKDNWLLDIQHKAYSNSPTYWGYQNTNWVVNNINLGVAPIHLCTVGGYIYLITSTSLLKVNTATGTWSTLVTGSNYTDIKYDGERYIYLPQLTGLSRLDTNDDSITFLATTSVGGVQTVVITGTHILCTPRSAAAQPVIVRVFRSSFTVDNSITPSFSWSSAYLMDGCTDDLGNAYFVPKDSSFSSYPYILKITPAGVTSAISPPSYTTTSQCVGAYRLDSNNLIFYMQFSNDAVYANLYNFRTNTFTNLSNCSSPGSTGSYRSGIAKINGVLVCSTRQAGSASSINTANLNNGTSLYPAVPVTSVPIASNLSDNYNLPMLFDGARIVYGTTTGVRVFTKINSNWPVAGTNLGQVVLPA